MLTVWSHSEVSQISLVGMKELLLQLKLQKNFKISDIFFHAHNFTAVFFKLKHEFSLYYYIWYLSTCNISIGIQIYFSCVWGENAVSNSFKPLGSVSLPFFIFLFLVSFNSFIVLIHCTFIHSVLSALYNFSTGLLHLHFLLIQSVWFWKWVVNSCIKCVLCTICLSYSGWCSNLDFILLDHRTIEDL